MEGRCRDKFFSFSLYICTCRDDVRIGTRERKEERMRERERIGELKKRRIEKTSNRIAISGLSRDLFFSVSRIEKFYGGARFLEALVTFLIKNYRENEIENVYVYVHIYIYTRAYTYVLYTTWYLFSFVGEIDQETPTSRRWRIFSVQ